MRHFDPHRALVLAGCLVCATIASTALPVLAQGIRTNLPARILTSEATPTQATEPDPAEPRRTRLYLADGTYQVVLSYRIKGKIVLYTSAERAGEEEQIPLKLVDLAATHHWEQQHATGAGATGPQGQPPIDPELLEEEEDRASLTPEVAPNLRLPELESVLALDQWQGTPELVPLIQSDGDLNRSTSHNIVKKILNPLAAAHELEMLQGERSAVQLHIETPVFYLRVGDDLGVSTGEAVTVDTHGSNAANAQPATTNVAASRYVVERVDVRVDARRIASFNTAFIGSTSTDSIPDADVVETTSVLVRGGHWLKLTPTRPLLPGEYVLMEVISDHVVNLGVWDFGIHPNAPDNPDTIKPQVKRPSTLERRQPE